MFCKLCMQRFRLNHLPTGTDKDDICPSCLIKISNGDIKLNLEVM